MDALRIECAAILFDLDGVLVDSAGYIERQWSEWAVSKGLDPAPFLRVCHGRRAEETIRLAAPHLDAQAEVARFRDRPSNDELRLPAMPGAVELVHRLPRSRWAVVTSGSRASATARLIGAGIPVPAVLISAEDVRRGKPDPQGYLTAAERLGFPPSQCVVIEDSEPGIAAARAAGARVVALRTGHGPADPGPVDAVTDSLANVRLEAPAPAGPAADARDAGPLVLAIEGGIPATFTATR